MGLQRIPASTLAISLAFASLIAACGSEGDSSSPGASGGAAFATTTLPPLESEPADPTVAPSSTETATTEPATAETTATPAASDDTATVATPAPGPAPTETAAPEQQPETTEAAATTSAAAAPTTTEQPATTEAPTTAEEPTTVEEPSTTSAPTTTAAPPTTTARPLSREEILAAAADNVSSLQPNNDRRLIEVLNVADGSVASLAAPMNGVVDGDRPVLLWFWAPH
ncbi:MAG: hypothetical protein OXH78_08535 [Acidimicrobiaceae bacterium]|nr:hypothetical protein [Acidimicrobiaceae bacterium]